MYLTSLHSPQRLPNLHFTAWFHFISKAKQSPSVFFSLDPQHSLLLQFLPYCRRWVPLSHPVMSAFSWPLALSAPTLPFPLPPYVLRAEEKGWRTLGEGPQEAREGQEGCWCPVFNPCMMLTLRAVLHLATQTSEMRASHEKSRYRMWTRDSG